jgi:hypothetical protein
LLDNKRRILTVEQKLTILRDAFGFEDRVRGACERHEVSSGMRSTLRTNAMPGQSGFVQPAATVSPGSRLPNRCACRILSLQRWTRAYRLTAEGD